MSDNVTALHNEPLTPMPLPGGREQFWNLLNFLDNKKSFEARLTKLEEATKKHNKAVKALGGFAGIERHLDEAAELKSNAKELMAKAEAHAKALIIKAEEDMDTQRQALRQQANKLTREQAELQEVAEAQAALDKEKAELDVRSKQLAAGELDLQKSLKAANEVRARFKAKLKEHQTMLNSLQT